MSLKLGFFKTKAYILYPLIVIVGTLDFLKYAFIFGIITNSRHDKDKRRLEILSYVWEAKNQSLGQKLGHKSDKD